MRYDDWPDRLEDYVNVKRNEAFKWGTNDCALFAKGAVEAIKSDAPTKDLVIRYRSQSGAIQWLKDHDAVDLWYFIDTYFTRIDVRQAQRGDLVGHITTDKSLGVCLNGMFATPSDDGILFASMTDAVTAWRID